MEKDYQDIKSFLENTDDIDSLCESDAVIFVDRRAYDEDIVADFNQKIGNQIQVQMQENGKPYGEDIHLTYQGKSLTIPYDQKMDRDTTILYVNEILKADYTIRWCAESIGSDTLGFVILENKMWEQLEEQFGKEKLEYYFEPLALQKRMFGLSIDEVFDLVDKRNKNRF